MEPNKKHPVKQLVILSWVFFITACGADTSFSPSISSPYTSPSPVTVSNAVASPKDMQVGDVFQLSVNGNESTAIDMSGVPANSEFVLALSNLNSSGDAATIQLASSENQVLDLSKSVESDSLDASEMPQDLTERFHEELRFKEMALSTEVPVSPESHAGLKAMSLDASVPKVGDTRPFQVLNSLSGGSTTSVTGQALCVTDNVVMYEDQEAIRKIPNDLTREDVQKLCNDYDRRIPKMRSLFGQESDVNGDGHIAVLMTPQINRMGAALGGLVTGFFYAGDLYGQNQMEILYTLVPDSGGVFGSTLDKDFVLTHLVPAVLVHELQHAISYNQHVLIRGGRPEDPIINEGLSHLSEDLMGLGSENYARYATFLSAPASYGLLSGGSPNLGARGEIYLFLRYLYEQSGNGDAFVNRLLNTDQTGMNNVEAAFAGQDSQFDQFAEFYMRWNATLALGSHHLSSDSRYSYQERVKDPDTGNWKGVTLLGNAEDGRGTVLNGVQTASYSGYGNGQVLPGGVEFFQVNNFSQPLYVYGRQGGTFGAVLVRVK